MKAKKRAAIRDAVKFEVDLARNGAGFSILTIEFAEGSDPRAIDIPYQPWNPRASVSLPFLLRRPDDS